MGTFFNRVLDIFGLSPKDQVSRIHALRYIASVKNLLPFWNRPIVEHPRENMGTDVPFAAHIKRTVTPTPITDPEPAVSGLVDIRPESFHIRFTVLGGNAHSSIRL